MFMIWDSSHEDLQLSDWVSNTASYGFISLYVNPPSYSYDRAFFLNLTFKIQGQSHSSRSHNRNNILSTHIPLVPCQSALPFPRYSIFKIWPWKSKVKVIAQGQKVGITPYRLTSLLFHVDRPCHSWDTAISKFNVENSRSRSRVRSKLKVITLGPTFSRLTSLSFHVDQASRSWVMTFSKFDLENQGSRSWVRS